MILAPLVLIVMKLVDVEHAHIALANDLTTDFSCLCEAKGGAHGDRWFDAKGLIQN